VIHIYQVQCRIFPDPASDKGAVVDTGAQRGAAKYLSEIAAHTVNQRFLTVKQSPQVGQKRC